LKGTTPAKFGLWFSGLREDLGVEVYDGSQLMAKAHMAFGQLS
jgi:hypothetical protein